MFSQHRGTTTLVTSSSSAVKPIYWVTVYSATKNEYYVKLANYAGPDTSITVSVPGTAATATLTQITGPQYSWNGPNNATIVPTVSTINKAGAAFTFTLRSYGVAVLSVAA